MQVQAGAPGLRNEQPIGCGQSFPLHQSSSLLAKVEPHPLLAYSRLPAAAVAAAAAQPQQQQQRTKMDVTTGPPPLATLPGPLAVLTARPEGDEGELGPECTYYVLGTAHVSAGRLREPQTLCTQPPLAAAACQPPAPDPPARPDSCAFPPCSQLGRELRGCGKADPGRAATGAGCGTRACCCHLPAASSAALVLAHVGIAAAAWVTLPSALQSSNCSLPRFLSSSGGAGGAVQRAQAHPHSRQNQGAEPAGGAPEQLVAAGKAGSCGAVAQRWALSGTARVQRAGVPRCS